MRGDLIAAGPGAAHVFTQFLNRRDKQPIARRVDVGRE
jgi:hypothetical protein